MRRAPDQVQNLIQPVVEAMHYELVGIEYIAQGKHSLLRIYIDNEQGINVDDCSTVSHQVSGVLDVEDVIKGQYNLEVSSPGLDRPLFTLEHFKRYANSQVKLKLSIPLDGQRNFVGTLLGVSDDGNEKIELNVEGNVVSLPINSIEKANLVPHF